MFQKSCLTETKGNSILPDPGLFKAFNDILSTYKDFISQNIFFFNSPKKKPRYSRIPPLQLPETPTNLCRLCFTLKKKP